MRLFPFATSFVLLAPVALAYGAESPKSFEGLVGSIIDIIGILTAIIFALIFLLIVWGVIKGWILNGGEAEGVEKGRQTLFAGIIALVIMFSLWGILALLQNSLFGI